MDARLTAEQIAQINEALSAGSRIEAIKLYREYTGVGLKEAHDAIVQWRMGAPAPQGSRRGTSPLMADQVSRINDALFAGEKVQAVKLYRDFTGSGLKDAYEAVLQIENALREEFPDRLPPRAADAPSHAPVSKPGCGAGALLALAVAAAWIGRFVVAP